MSLNTVVKPTIFREYIGPMSCPGLHNFPDIINPEISEFHFILAFATEDYGCDGRGTGKFQATWNVQDFSTEKIKELKKEHKNAKVVISIGGRGVECPFNPIEKQKWIDNAKFSLKIIIQDYKDPCSCITVIDGIDINYEHIKSDDFVECIGEVIEYLKKDVLINVVSIAPSAPVLSQYKTLYKEQKCYINWVDYQFYDQCLSSKCEFEKLYRDLSDVFKDKLLAGYSTDPNDKDNQISPEDFLKACEDLIKCQFLPGIFVWNANYSADDHPPFYFEKLAQELLTKCDKE
ncbi:chitinase 2-like [Abrus precatorius]|uniref:Chitinase 2-like n=1 Tax=Abrus precatorius TaxID=3816 RepID=A0A8B8K3U4_ABRPR|nr:chitinase 2-like [Abrus precatorius]